jgi:hypothetical protein
VQRRRLQRRADPRRERRDDLHRISECNLNPPSTCVSDVVNAPASDDAIARCATCASTHTCQEIEVGVCDVDCN